MESLEEQYRFQYSSSFCMQWEGTVGVSLLTMVFLQPAPGGRHMTNAQQGLNATVD